MVSVGTILVLAASALGTPPASQPTSAWPMWGGAPDRNAVTPQARIPAEWDLDSDENIKWSVALGSYSYAGPVIAGGCVLVGTNNERELRPHSKGDRGVVLCLDATDGKLLWQATHDKHPLGQAVDWPLQGVASTPYVEGERVYYVSNRGELVCADLRGFHDDENDGPLRDEPHHDKLDADFVWILDMMAALDVYPHNLAACAPVGAGDLLFVCTANGTDDRGAVPKPQAPSFIAVNKQTGKVVWQRNDPGDDIMHGQWSSPAYGVIDGTAQVVFGGGDGWCYAFEPQTGKPLWKFNLNPPDTVWKQGGTGTRTSIVATPVIHNARVYLAVGDDPENAPGPGHLYAIDATKRGDITQTGRVWHFGGEEFGRTVASVAVADGLVYAADLDGYLSCFDAATGKRHWKHDMWAGVWASPTIIGDRVLLGTTDGELVIMKHGRAAEEFARIDMHFPIYTVPVAVDGTLYIVTQRHLYAIADPQSTPTTRPAGASSPTSQPSRDWPQFRGNPQQTGVAGCELSPPLERVWRYDAGASITSTAAITDGVVYIATEDGELIALDGATGKPQWKQASADGDMIESSPTVAGDLVIVGDEAGLVRACDRKTGALRWTFAAGTRVVSSANIVGDRVVFGSYDQHLYCLRLSDGKLLWKYAGVEERIHGTPAIVGEYVLVAACDANVHVVRLDDGTAVRTVALGSVSGSSPAIRDDRAVVGCYGNQVVCVDWRAGTVPWQFEDKQRGRPFVASAAVTDKLALIGGRDKKLHAFDLRTGRPVWQFATRGQVDGSPVVSGDHVWVGSEDGNLYALRVSDGEQVWRYETGSRIYASPAIGRERLVISTDDGVVYCFGPTDTE